MDSNSHSLPNQLISELLQALDELIGTNGLRSLLNASGLHDWITSPPEANVERAIDYEQFSRLSRTLEDLYGNKGAHSLMRRAHASIFKELWIDRTDLADEEQLEIKNLEPSAKLIQALSSIVPTLSDSTGIAAHLEHLDSGSQVRLDDCPYCWDASDDSPMCHAFIGLLEGAIRMIVPDLEITFAEVGCKGMGADACVFTLQLAS